MLRLLGLVLVASSLCCWTGTAAAERRAYVLVGTDSPFVSHRYRGSPFATEVSRFVRALTVLEDGRIVLMTDGGTLSVVDTLGRITDVARLPDPYGPTRPGVARYELERERGGTLLAVVAGRIFRLAPDFSYAEVTIAGVRDARGVDPLDDGGFLLAAGHRVFRVSADGSATPLAGSGSARRAQEGPALGSPAGAPLDVVQRADGAMAFTDARSHSVLEVRDGLTRRLAGGGRNARDLPSAGRPARSVRLFLFDGGGLEELDDGSLALVTDAGLRAVASGRIRELVRGAADPPRGFPPVWAGDRAGRSWLYAPTTFAPTTGEWVLGGYNGLMLVTRPDGGSSRLAAAVLSSTQRSVWRRAVSISLTQPARVVVRVRSGGRVVATGQRDAPAGLSTLRLSRALPGRVSTVELRARAGSGAFASHSRRVLGLSRLPLAAARRTLRAWGHPGGDAWVEVTNCRRLGTRRIRCRLMAGGDGTTDVNERVTLTLRRDGWIEARSTLGRARLEVL